MSKRTRCKRSCPHDDHQPGTAYAVVDKLLSCGKRYRRLMLLIALAVGALTVVVITVGPALLSAIAQIYLAK